ncbi:MAG: hypothetical protein L3J65_01430 [Robiginitomaculum sp.]|nr:hypothetical protein [Robiginitomaculum sp.]
MSVLNNRPDGRLIPVFAVDDGLWSADLVLALAKAAAMRGETVLMIDQMGGHLMDKAGIVVGATLSDVLDGKAQMLDAKYVNNNEHFTAVCTGETDLETLLGSLAALSLSYDWVFIGARAGCTPAHIRLAGAADAALMMYDSQGDKFMRAYWMLDAIRARVAKFDPLMIAQIGQASCEKDGFETYELLSGTIRDFLGAAPALGGILESSAATIELAPVLLEALRQDSKALQRRA